MKIKLILMNLLLTASMLYADSWREYEKTLTPPLTCHSRVYIGYTAMQYHYRLNTQNVNTRFTGANPTHGVTIGYTRCSNMTTHNVANPDNTHNLPLFFEWGINLTWQYSNDFLSITNPIKENNLDLYTSYHYLGIGIPLNVSYIFQIGDFYIRPFVGPNVRINVFAQNYTTEQDICVINDLYNAKTLVKNTNIGEKENVEYIYDYKIKPVQIGFNIGIGYGWKRLSINYQYQRDFMPFIKYSTAETSTKCMVGQHMVCLGVAF